MAAGCTAWTPSQPANIRLEGNLLLSAKRVGELFVGLERGETRRDHNLSNPSGVVICSQI